MPEFKDLSGAGRSNIELPYKNTLLFPVTFMDSNNDPINLAGREFVMEVYRNQPAANIYTIQGVLSDDVYTVTFTHAMELPVGLYRYRVNRVDGGIIKTRVTGQLKITR